MSCEDTSIIVVGAGCSDANGLYKLVGSYGEYPMWRQSYGLQFYIWRNSSQGEWRIGLKNDYYYVNSSEDPFQGEWSRNTGACSNDNAVDPPPTVTTPIREKLLLWIDINRFSFSKVDDSAGTADFPFPFVVYDTGASNAAVNSERHLKIKCDDAEDVEWVEFVNNSSYEINFTATDPYSRESRKQFSKPFHWMNPSLVYKLKEDQIKQEGGIIQAVFQISAVQRRVVRPGSSLARSDDGSWAVVSEASCPDAAAVPRG